MSITTKTLTHFLLLLILFTLLWNCLKDVDPVPPWHHIMSLGILNEIIQCQNCIDKPVHPRGHQSWVFIGRTDVEAETPIFWPHDVKSWLICKDPDVGKDWGQEEEGTNRGWDGWMASPTWWTWVWVNSGSWWWTRRPGMLRFMGSQRVRHDGATELNWTC